MKKLAVILALALSAVACGDDSPNVPSDSPTTPPGDGSGSGRSKADLSRRPGNRAADVQERYNDGRDDRATQQEHDERQRYSRPPVLDIDFVNFVYFGHDGLPSSYEWKTRERPACRSQRIISGRVPDWPAP